VWLRGHLPAIAEAAGMEARQDGRRTLPSWRPRRSGKNHRAGTHALRALRRPLNVRSVTHDLPERYRNCRHGYFGRSVGGHRRRISWEASDILPIRPPHPSTSRHCVDLYCYNTDEKLDGLVNWWSDEWGQQGTGLLLRQRTSLHLSGAVIFILSMLSASRILSSTACRAPTGWW